MKYLLIALLLLSCAKNKPVESKASLEDLQAKRDLYVELIKDPYALVERCDGLTFIGLFDAYGRRVDIYAHEYDNDGVWHRSVQPCYSVGDSRSEVSFEGLLGATHSLLARHDMAGLKRMYDYLEDNSWIAGEGPAEYTRVLQLRPLLKAIVDSDLRISNSEDASVLSGYKGNVVADYLAVHAVAFGYLKSWHTALLKELYRKNPGSPIYSGMYHKFTDGDTSEAVTALADETMFPADALPEGSLAIFDWADASAAILYIYTVSLLELGHGLLD